MNSESAKGSSNVFWVWCLPKAEKGVLTLLAASTPQGIAHAYATFHWQPLSCLPGPPQTHVGLTQLTGVYNPEPWAIPHNP